MQKSETMTIGAFLASAEAQLIKTGGLSAEVLCEERVVRLLRTAPGQSAVVLGQAPLPHGIAGEDVAGELLDAYAPDGNPSEVAYARDRYFPITFR